MNFPAVLCGDRVQTYLHFCLLLSLFGDILITEALLFCLRCPAPYNLLIALFLSVWMNYVLVLCSPERKHTDGARRVLLSHRPLAPAPPYVPLFRSSSP